MELLRNICYCINCDDLLSCDNEVKLD